MNKGNQSRRRIIISSDEEDEPDKNEFLSDDESRDDIVEDSYMSKKSEEDKEDVVKGSDESDECVLDDTRTPAKNTSKGSSFASSTPMSKTKSPEFPDPDVSVVLSDSLDRMSFKEDRVGDSLEEEDESAHDRSRSFHKKEQEMTPISKRLVEKGDRKSQQQLRERMLRKNLNRASAGSRSSRDRDPLFSSTLSPIVPKPIPGTKKTDEKPSPMRVSDVDENEIPSNTSRKTLSVSAGFISPLKPASPIDESLNSTGPGAMETSNSVFVSPPKKEDSVKKENTAKMSLTEVLAAEPVDEKAALNSLLTLSSSSQTSVKAGDMDVSAKEAEPELESWKNEEPKKFMKKNKKVSMGDVFSVDSPDREKTSSTRTQSSSTNKSDKFMTPRKSMVILSDEEEEKEEEDNSIVVIDDSDNDQAKESSSIVIESDEEGDGGRESGDEEENETRDEEEEEEDLDQLKMQLEQLLTLQKKKSTLALPDGGKQIDKKIKALMERIEHKSKDYQPRRVQPKFHVKRTVIDDESPAKENPELYDRLLTDDKHRFFGGKMTENRMETIKVVTANVIETMHKEISSNPEDEPTETPRGFKIPLMNHQKNGLTWMLWREKQQSPGGILADDMGLGKTMSMISLILETKNRRLERETEESKNEWKKAVKARGLVPSHATLVIAPASVIYQWEKEIENRVKPNRLSVHVLHGDKKKREKNPKRLACHDIVITTYNLVSSELTEKVNITNSSDSEEDSEDDEDRPRRGGNVKRKNKVSKHSSSVLARIAWERIILDEAHQIKNRQSLISKAVCRLHAMNRWCLTGTPIHNNLWDFFSLIRFMRVSPFDEEKMWKEYLMRASQHSTSRLNTLVKSLLLRRTKQQIDSVTNKPLVDLKPKRYELHNLNLEGLEREIYAVMFESSKQKVKDLLKNQEENLYGFVRRQKKKAVDEPVRNPFLVNGVPTDDNFQKMSYILVILLRLRQACVHFALTRNAMDLEAFEGLDMKPEEVLEAGLAEMSLDENALNEHTATSSAEDVEKLFENSFLSTKLRLLMSKMDHILSVGDKCVVVSQWSSFLDIVELHLKQRGVKYTCINGRVPTQDRQERVDSFNKEGSGAKVMLLSLTAGGVGLNLIGGNHLFLVDLHWNPALEAQACDRIYRMGQKKEVFIHKLVTVGTIEQRVLSLQDQKSQLAKSVLEGAANRKLNKLTMADLKFLFELDTRREPKAPAPAQPPAAVPQFQAASRLVQHANGYDPASIAVPLGRPKSSPTKPIELITL